jgi:hypothetical protein
MSERAVYVEMETDRMGNHSNYRRVAVFQIGFDERGRVTGATAISGHPLGISHLMGAVSEWKLKPVIIKGAKKTGRGSLSIKFRRLQKAFGRPTQIINDAAMQALGSYRGRRMLFLGLGTGLGSALIVDGVLEPMELAHLPYKNGKTFEAYIGDSALKRRGRKKWTKSCSMWSQN